MTAAPLPQGLGLDPIDALLTQPGAGVLAVIAGIEGPSYRPLGATMAILGDGRRIGSLSSGCIEHDIALRAQDALRSGGPAKVRYGRGSPFVDLTLPCGGGMDILLLPRPDPAVLARLAARRNARLASTLSVDTATGALALTEHPATGARGTAFDIRFRPDIRFLIFGKGPEAATFAALVRSAAYPGTLFSPDPETLAHGAASGCATHRLTRPEVPAGVVADRWTAVVLFFHDHDWEPPILSSPAVAAAFYLGAQGSLLARTTRNGELAAMGLGPEHLARIRGPIGLVPSARDSRTLAISVLAEVLAVAADDPAAAAGG